MTEPINIDFIEHALIDRYDRMEDEDLELDQWQAIAENSTEDALRLVCYIRSLTSNR